MIIQNIGHSFDYEMEKLARIFLPFERIITADSIGQEKIWAICRIEEIDGKTHACATL